MRIVAAFTLAHFVFAFIIGAIAFGLDFDQLRSRTWWSRAAAAVHDVLWFPHDTFLRSLPIDWKIANHKWVTPTAIVANSLLWGLALTALWLAWRRARPRS